MIISFKSQLDCSNMDFIRPSIPLLLSYPLKDIPSKLTVDGRRNLIAVVSKRLLIANELYVTTTKNN